MQKIVRRKQTYPNDARLKSRKEYTITIEKMYVLLKTDEYFRITGTWKCNFIR